MTGNVTLDYIINGILGLLLAVIGFFLKRTMTDLDKTKSDVEVVKRDCAKQATVDCIEKEVESIKLDYTPRADFNKLESKIDKVTETIHEVQLKSVSKEDFFIKMSELASTLERMEDKMERYRDGK